MNKAIDTPGLLAANLLAQKAAAKGGGKGKGFNNTIPAGISDVLDPNGIHIVKQMTLHSNAVRCRIFAKLTTKDDPYEFWFDMPLRTYNALPTVEQVKAAQEEAMAQQGASA